MRRMISCRGCAQARIEQRPPIAREARPVVRGPLGHATRGPARLAHPDPRAGLLAAPGDTIEGGLTGRTDIGPGLRPGAGRHALHHLGGHVVAEDLGLAAHHGREEKLRVVARPDDGPGPGTRHRQDGDLHCCADPAAPCDPRWPSAPTDRWLRSRSHGPTLKRTTFFPPGCTGLRLGVEQLGAPLGLVRRPVHEGDGLGRQIR